jgi:hypothetical protein
MRCALAFPALLFVLGTALSAAENVKVVEGDHKLTIKIGDLEFATLNYAPDQPKPYFSPVKAADGTVITRPLNDPNDKDHPHHKGVWNAVDEVNEVDFWAEKGKIESKSVEWAESGDSLQLVLKNDWMGPEGPVVHETATVTIYPNRLMVYHIVFTKPDKVPTVTFEDTKEGMFGIRVATSMRGDKGGVITNADGLEGEQGGCWGKPSNWVDYTGKVGDKLYGVTLMDSPKNFRPSRYHCRNYGLFTMSPFGEGSYQNDKTKAKPFTLDADQPKLELTYGLYVHTGNAKEGNVSKAYEQFVKAAE